MKSRDIGVRGLEECNDYSFNHTKTMIEADSKFLLVPPAQTVAKYTLDIRKPDSRSEN